MPSNTAASDDTNIPSAARDCSASRAVRMMPNTNLRALAPNDSGAEELRFEDEVLQDVDVDADLVAVIPMPPTIPTSLRVAITTSACRRFEYHSDLHDWLNAPHAKLAGRTPFELIVAGDGETVLLALNDESDCISRARNMTPSPAEEMGGATRDDVVRPRPSDNRRRVRTAVRKAAS